MKFPLCMGLLATLLVSFAQLSFAQQQDANSIQLTFSFSPAEMYQTWCASCHGVTGKGDGPAATALKQAPTDLTQLSKKNSGRFPTQRVRDFIEGNAADAAHGSREMPVWGQVFRRIDASSTAVGYRVNSLAAYIEGLQAK